ncbi:MULTISPECIES: DUF1778 domain-containing protein [Thalassospira]|jgi:uncharacterized protein (DUF1778 family)|uniref:DUF1778 domain-containing protein n=2 Tax=Thalassospira TaxID=168934 RepID=A0A367W067_9PROT|nr:MULTISPECIES: DUF1778 domain-containing protein [Thalassospira]MDG4717870.1 DUF1778 domain-containing protein [Thalassospira sp. FZY0004]RCK32385.1 hypothetical protein TH19_19015 [Thalassospira profundimaris]
MSEENETSSLFGQVTVQLQVDEELVIRQAMKLAGTESVVEYIIQASIMQATRDLAGQTVFSLDKDKASEFLAALDHPPEPNDALKELFAHKTIIE